MTQSLDYNLIATPNPTEEPRTDWHYSHRRAELLTIIINAGGPARLNQRELAKRYGVSPATICRDMSALSDFIAAEIGNDFARDLYIAYRNITKALHEQGDYLEEWKVHREYGDWLFDVGALDRAPAKSEVEMDLAIGDALSSDHYTIIPDDATLEALGANGELEH